MPAENSPVNHLTTALFDDLVNATGERLRECQAVGRLLVRCEACDLWDIDHGCQRMEREAWVRLLITPGRECDRMPT